MKIVYKYLLLFLIGITNVFFFKNATAQNIALHKPYILSPTPNYNTRTQAAFDTTLTDGKYTTESNFRSRPTTLGWVKTAEIKITVDLGKINTINSVTFNTCRRVDSLFNIRYPSHIFIFLSLDNNHFSYAGDAAADSDNLPGPYTIKKFVLDSIRQQARYINFCIIPNGFFVFCDEISVIKGVSINTQPITYFDTSLMDKTIDSLISGNFKKNYLIEANKNLIKITNGSIRKTLQTNVSQLNSKKVSIGSLTHIDSLTRIAYLKKLREQFKGPFIIEKVSPWDTLSPFHLPNSIPASFDYQFVIPQGGTQYGAFVLTNTNSFPQIFLIKPSFKKEGIISFDLFDAYFIPALDYKMIPDALIPLNSNSITINAGMSKLLIFKMNGNNVGNTDVSLTITSNKITKALNAKVQVLQFNNFNNFQLNSNVWINNYHPMIIDRQESAFEDLKNHHINTIVIGPGYLSPLNKPQFSSLPKFLSNCLYAKKLLVATEFSNRNYREPDPSILFMSTGWKSAFVKWYDSLLSVIKESGFTSSQVYFYPYDEVHGASVADFLQFAQWVKTSVPQVQLYATLTKSVINTSDNFNQLIKLLDIAQIASSDPIVLPKLPVHKGEIWVYENNGRSKSESPYSHYRLMAWDAFLNDVTGIGFWSYAGDPRKKFITDAFRDIDMDYGVIYDGPGKSIISSRRWEAFSLGIEDYQILYLYAEKFGTDKAKVLAKQVLSKRNNINLADEIRNQMINSLEKE